MKLTTTHTLAFGRWFLLLFFLANSGFTVVLYHCTMTHCAMTEGKSATACCTRMAGCTVASCNDVAGPQASVAHVVTVGQPCQTATVAGGYQTEPTVIEKSFTSQQTVKADLLSAAVFETAFDSRVDLPAFRLASASSNVSTSSVETYVLNASFLI